MNILGIQFSKLSHLHKKNNHSVESQRTWKTQIWPAGWIRDSKSYRWVHTDLHAMEKSFNGMLISPFQSQQAFITFRVANGRAHEMIWNV